MYRLIRFLIQIGLRQFYSSITIRGVPVEDGSLLVVGNHQNFALDSLTVSLGYQRELWYLGKATLFKNKILGSFLRSLHVAPLYRKQDDPTKMDKNADTFKAVSELLSSNRAVLLFPEGVSLGERKLQPIKTGAARMAFQAESESGFTLGLKIQPVGITYADLTLFRSSVTLFFGEPIQVADFKDQFALDGVEAVRQLTSRIEESLRLVSVDIHEREIAVLVEQIAKLYRGSGSKIDDYERFRLIARNVEVLSVNSVKLRTEVEGELSRFQGICQLFGVDIQEPKTGNTLKTVIWSPFVALGAVLNYMPYQFIGWWVNARFADPLYYASSKFLLGMVLFPLWFIGVGLLVGLIMQSFLFGAIVVLVMAILAWSTNRYLYDLKLLMLGLRGIFGSSPLKFIDAERSRIISKFNALRIE